MMKAKVFRWLFLMGWSFIACHAATHCEQSLSEMIQNKGLTGVVKDYTNLKKRLGEVDDLAVGSLLEEKLSEALGALRDSLGSDFSEDKIQELSPTNSSELSQDEMEVLQLPVAKMGIRKELLEWAESDSEKKNGLKGTSTEIVWERLLEISNLFDYVVDLSPSEQILFRELITDTKLGPSELLDQMRSIQEIGKNTRLKEKFISQLDSFVSQRIPAKISINKKSRIVGLQKEFWASVAVYSSPLLLISGASLVASTRGFMRLNPEILLGTGLVGSIVGAGFGIAALSELLYRVTPPKAYPSLLSVED